MLSRIVRLLIAHDRAVVNKDILAGFIDGESVAFIVVEPFDDSVGFTAHTATSELRQIHHWRV